jgi:hypothetical protein
MPSGNHALCAEANFSAFSRNGGRRKLIDVFFGGKKQLNLHFSACHPFSAFDEQKETAPRSHFRVTG